MLRNAILSYCCLTAMSVTADEPPAFRSEDARAALKSFQDEVTRLEAMKKEHVEKATGQLRANLEKAAAAALAEKNLEEVAKIANFLESDSFSVTARTSRSGISHLRSENAIKQREIRELTKANATLAKHQFAIFRATTRTQKKILLLLADGSGYYIVGDNIQSVVQWRSDGKILQQSWRYTSSGKSEGATTTIILKDGEVALEEHGKPLLGRANFLVAENGLNRVRATVSGDPPHTT